MARLMEEESTVLNFLTQANNAFVKLPHTDHLDREDFYFLIRRLYDMVKAHACTREANAPAPTVAEVVEKGVRGAWGEDWQEYFIKTRPIWSCLRMIAGR